MSASQEIFSSENTLFDLNSFISNFKIQHDEHCQKLGKNTYNNIGVQIQKSNTRYPHIHYKITTGDYFTGDLIDFFKKHGVHAHPGINNEIFIYRKELENSSLTYQDAQRFLSELHQTIRRIEGI